MKSLTFSISLLLCFAFGSTIFNWNEDGTRVTNGIPADPGFYPYLAAVTGNGIFVGGGVIISENWVLTTALCINGYLPKLLKVRVGARNRTDPTEPGAYNEAIDRYSIHGGWDYSYKNNLAIMHMAKPLIFSYVVKAVQMADQPIDMTLPAAVAGFGGTDDFIDKTSILEYNLNVKLIDESFCVGHAFIPNSICSNSTDPNPTLCLYDQGGPLVQSEDGTEKMILYGIISHRDCQSDHHTFYENILNHRGWIYMISDL